MLNKRMINGVNTHGTSSLHGIQDGDLGRIDKLTELRAIVPATDQ